MANTRSARRGFTLVELLVAVMAGLFVSLAAFVLARNAAYFFQHEARISSAQLSAMLGMERLLADIERASFLSTPNIQTSLKRCPPSNGGAVAGLPAGLAKLAGIRVDEGTGELPQSAANGMKPDRITIGGAFDTTEAFGVTDVQADGAGWKVHLDMKSHEMARTLAAGKSPAELFKAGRFLRFVDREARYEYFSIISGYDAASGAVRVAASPLMPPSSAMPTCGLHGLETGGTANPVARVRYDIRSLKAHPRYQEIVKPISPEASGDDGRTELVRVELDANDNEIADSLELIAEYAVDLKIGFTAVTRGALPPPELNECPAPALQSVYHCPIPMSSAVYQRLGGPVDAGALPELIQTVSARLVTRARAPDRDADLVTGPDGRKLRFRIDLPGPQKPKYARLRTVYAEKLLRNQETP
jgi:prepilin-type N-terminal cleavage/methylation domain-containing protein